MVEMTNLRKLVGKILRRLVRPGRRYIQYALYVFQQRLKSIGALLGYRDRNEVRQYSLEWELEWPAFSNPEQLESWLRDEGIEFSTGRWTIYIPPQANLDRVLGKVVKFYPASAGYKVLRDFRPPDQAVYCFQKAVDVTTLKRQKKRGRVFENIQNANFLYTHGLGPRCWDLTTWHASEQSYTVFVVDHVRGLTPDAAQHRAFIAALRDLESSPLLEIVVPGKWEEHKDFNECQCNGNLILEEKTHQAQYIDFQNLVVNSRLWAEDIIDKHKDVFHFGDTNPLTRREFLYQSVPGFRVISKRNVGDRWRLIEDELKAVGISLVGRVVLDVGCNQGMMIFSSLSAGAKWCLGWDLPQVVEQSEKLLFSLGASRFHLVGAELDEEYSLINDVPSRILPHLDESVVLYLSVRKHVGMMRNLTTIPWRVLVYEGHHSEDLDCLPQILESFLSEQVDIRRATIKSDGPGGAKRPIAILVRGQPEVN